LVPESECKACSFPTESSLQASLPRTSGCGGSLKNSIYSISTDMLSYLIYTQLHGVLFAMGEVGHSCTQACYELNKANTALPQRSLLDQLPSFAKRATRTAPWSKNRLSNGGSARSGLGLVECNDQLLTLIFRNCDRLKTISGCESCVLVNNIENGFYAPYRVGHECFMSRASHLRCAGGSPTFSRICACQHSATH